MVRGLQCASTCLQARKQCNNSLASLQSTLPLLNPCAQPDHTTKTETETYDIYLVPPGEDPETCQSWLRMRNRDGRYNLMFEEWVTEGPFIISPRITFEVRSWLRGLPTAYQAAHSNPCLCAGT